MIYTLVGIGRSGTSLLQSILFHQDDLVVYPETQFFRRLLIANNGKELSRKKLLEMLSIENSRFGNLQRYIDFGNLEKEKYNVNEVISLFEKGNKSIVFKDARNLDYLSEISDYVPDIKVICTIRDLRDVVLSRMKAAFSRRWGLILNLIIMRCQYTSLIKFEEQQRVFLVRYEDFTHGNFRGLKDLNIINKGLKGIDLNEIAEILFSKEELQKHKKKNKKTVDGANFNKWENGLPKRTIFIVELMFSDYFKRFDYKRNYTGAGVSIANSIIAYLFSMIHFIYYWISVYRDKSFYKV